MARYGVTSKYYIETFDTTTKTYVFRNVIRKILTTTKLFYLPKIKARRVQIF